MKRLIFIFLMCLALPAKSQMSTEEMVATMLNLNGFLCAEVTSMRKLSIGNNLEVTCVMYRGGSATSSYVIDLTSGKAFKQ